MSGTQRAEGSCLCGSVRIVAAEMQSGLGACHCEMCRKWTGGPLLSVPCGPNVEFDGEENIGVYDSSPWTERGFCKKCGSGLFYRLKGNRHYVVPVGLFDKSEGVVLNMQWFIDKKPEYYAFSNETDTLTEAEVFAKFGPSSDS